jgi:hypothetical protein
MERPDQRFEPPAPAFTELSERAAPHLPLRGPRLEELAALQAHPRFAAAHRIAATGIIELWQRNRVLNALVNDRTRWHISQFAVYLHMLSRPNDPHSGLTVSRMTALCSEQDFCSPGRAKAMLMLMRTFGYLAPAPSEADRRLRRLVPTERLMSLQAERNRRIFSAAAMVLPRTKRLLRRNPIRTSRDSSCAGIAKYFLAGFRFLDLVPEMRLFPNATPAS